MPDNNHLYYFYDSSHHNDPGVFIYWPIPNDLIEPIANQINQIFYSIYQLPLRLNSWHTVLHQLFNVIDVKTMLPATLTSIQYDINHQDLSHTPAIILRQGQTDQKPKDRPVLCTTIDVSKLQKTGKSPIALSKDQVKWLNDYFNGKIKVTKHETNKKAK